MVFTRFFRNFAVMRKGRDRTLINERDRKLFERYYYWTEVRRLRFDDTIQKLLPERAAHNPDNTPHASGGRHGERREDTCGTLRRIPQPEASGTQAGEGRAASVHLTVLKRTTGLAVATAGGSATVSDVVVV